MWFQQTRTYYSFLGDLPKGSSGSPKCANAVGEPTMDELPPEAIVGLSETQRAELSVWWSKLTSEERAEFSQRWDQRAESVGWYATQHDGKTEWHEVPVEVRGFFTADRLEERETAEWKMQLNEYINSHEDILFFLLDGQPLHICRAHKRAREVVGEGLIPPEFSCPFEHEACPFVTALNRTAERRQGRGIELRLCKPHVQTPRSILKNTASSVR